MVDFRKMIFGKTDAQEESAAYIELLVNGYLFIDDININKQVLETNKFLFLSYKGLGNRSRTFY